MQCVKQKSTHEYLKPPSSRKVQFKTGAEERGMQTRFRNIKFARLFGKIWQKRERERDFSDFSLAVHPSSSSNFVQNQYKSNTRLFQNHFSIFY